MPGFMRIRIWDVEHGACVMLQHITPVLGGLEVGGKLAMIDSGSSSDFQPSRYIAQVLNRKSIDYLFITNADQDHMSDLHAIGEAGIDVRVLFRNASYTGDEIRRIKLIGGPVSRDANWYINACAAFDQPVKEPFNECMGGITCRTFCNSYPSFHDTNNLSLAVFIKYAGFSMLFPGDLEAPGWKALLQRPDFLDELRRVNILMASHHGRQSGFCQEVFDFVTPQAIVISDKAKQHATQETLPDYREVSSDHGVLVRTTMKRRHCLTTRRDGWIQFDVSDDGNYFVDTEFAG